MNRNHDSYVRYISGVNFSIRKSVNYGTFRFSEVAGGGASWAAARVGLRSVFLFVFLTQRTIF